MSTLLEQGEAGAATAPAGPGASPAGGRGLRRRAARGTIVNAAFLVALAGLGLVQRLLLARLLTPGQFGLWNVALLAVLTVLFLKNAGIGDRFVSQREEDQERAFQKAFTIDLVLAGACVLVALVAVPLLALAYGRTSIIAPGLVLSLAIVGNSLQAPVWIPYRDMDYGRQRRLMAVEPIVAFILTVVLAVAGAGTWSLVIGAVVGAFAGAAVALGTCPYRPRLVWDPATVRDYFGFSWPVVAAGGAGMLIAQVSQLVATRIGGLRGSGAVGVGVGIAGFTDGVDGIVTQTLYPAICAVADRPALLLESFVKSNRLALLWGMPFGLGVALFAPDLVRFVVGEKWHFAVWVIAAFGVVSAFDQLGFNWTAYLRALNLTRPMAWLAALQTVVFLAVVVPLFLAFGLNGFAAGWVVLGLATVGGRAVYLGRLFSGFSMARHTLRALAPSLPAVAVVLAMKALIGGHGAAGAGAELTAYVVLTVAVSAVSERVLLAEVLSYLARRRQPAPAAAPRG